MVGLGIRRRAFAASPERGQGHSRGYQNEFDIDTEKADKEGLPEPESGPVFMGDERPPRFKRNGVTLGG